MNVTLNMEVTFMFNKIVSFFKSVYEAVAESQTLRAEAYVKHHLSSKGD
jgi:hypothetical protein